MRPRRHSRLGRRASLWCRAAERSLARSVRDAIGPLPSVWRWVARRHLEHPQFWMLMNPTQGSLLGAGGRGRGAGPEGWARGPVASRKMAPRQTRGGHTPPSGDRDPERVSAWGSRARGSGFRFRVSEWPAWALSLFPPRSGARPGLTPPARTLQRGQPSAAKARMPKARSQNPPHPCKPTGAWLTGAGGPALPKAPGRVTWSPGSASVTRLRATPGHTDVTAHKPIPGPLVHVHRIS